MTDKVNHILDTLSDFLAHRKGFLPLVGVSLVLVNAVLQFFPQTGWLGETDLLLHLGVIVAIIGFLLGWAL